jgi:ketosteroid isomerase-like protein
MQDQSDVIRGMYEAFARGDVAAVMAKLSPDVIWNEAENFVYADGSPYVGPQAVLAGIFMRLATEWNGFTVHPEEIIGAGDKVIARGRYRAEYKATGVAVNAQFAHVWQLRDGQVVSFQEYTDTAQFRDAVAKSARA